MKKLTKSIVLMAFIASVAFGAHINAMKVPGNVSQIGPDSKAWLSASYTDVYIYPQTTLKFLDKEANELNEENKAKKVRMKAIYDGTNISFFLRWEDSSQSIQTQDSMAYGDGFALQFPKEYKDIKTLPYIGMGSKNRAVIVHLNKASEGIYEPNGDANVYYQVDGSNQNLYEEELQRYEDEVAQKVMSYQKNFISEGFRAMSEIKDDSTKASMQMSYKDGYWSATLSRELKDGYLDLNNGAFVFAIAIWDGDKKNRDGLKHLSSWIPVKLVGKSGGDELIKELGEMPKGDIQNGKQLALENCAACHQYANEKMAPDFMAPNLSNIGGYSTKEYLLESITNPSAVVVPGYNRKSHPNFEWYSVDEKGVRTSTMPPYDWMDEKSRNDLVAFFSTLKQESE